MSVTKNAVIEASIAILNRDGIAKLNMRAIANELGIKAASLYNHIKNKDDLYNEIVDFLCASATEPDAALPAREFIVQEANIYRQMLLSVRDIIPIFDQSMPNTPARLQIIRQLIEKVAELGVARQNLMIIANMINNYIMSFTEYEVRMKSLSSEVISQLTRSILPENPETDEHTATDLDLDEQFQLGLEILLNGIENTKN